MDTRDALIAVGSRRVVKTAFLRLIPLLYGALRSVNLSGSSHPWIRYRVMRNKSQAPDS